MSIQLVTYANQTVTPMNDAIIYEKAVNQNGIFNGCNVTVTSNEVHITGGYGLVCGREFVINSEAITVTLAPSGTLLGRLYVRLDLADADAPIQLLTVTGNTLPALIQDADVNYTNGVYEMELATFDVGVSALSNVVETYDTIEGSVHYNGSGGVTVSGNVTAPNITSLQTLLTNPFYYEIFTASGYDFTANQYRQLTKSITARSGYSRIIVQVSCTSHSALDVFNYSLSSDSISYEVINRTSSSVTGAAFTFKVLYVKNGLITAV